MKITLLFLIITPFLYCQVPLIETSVQKTIDSLINGQSESDLKLAEVVFASYKTGLPDKDFKQIENFSFITSFENGFAIAKKNNQFVIINRKLRAVKTLEVNHATALHQGKSIVGISSENGILKKFGLINTKGEQQIPLHCKKLFLSFDGYVGLVDEKLIIYNEKIEEQHIMSSKHDIEMFNPNFILIKDGNFIKSVIHTSGIIIKEFPFEQNVVVRENVNKIFITDSDQTDVYSKQGIHVATFDWALIYLYDKPLIPVGKNGEFFLFNSLTDKLTHLGNKKPRAYPNYGFVTVSLGDYYGLMDNDGNEIIPVEFDMCYNVSKNVVTVSKDGRDFIVDLRNKKYTDVESIISSFNEHLVIKNEYYQVINAENQSIFDKKFDSIQLLGDYIILGNGQDSFNHTIYLDKKLNFYFEKIQNNFSVYNFKGEKISSFVAEKIHYTRYGYFFYNNGKMGMFNQLDGSIVIEAKYDDIIRLNLTDYYLVSQDEKYGLIYQKGKINKEVIPPTSSSQVKIINGVYITARINKNDKIFDLKGSPLLPFEYESAEVYYNNYILYKNKGLFGLFDMSTKTNILDPEFSSIYFENSKKMIAKKNGLNGVLNMDGSVHIPFNYEYLKYDTLAIQYTKNKKCGLLSLDGKVLIEPIYSAIGHFYKNGYAKVKDNNLFGVIDTLGKLVISITYREIYFFGNNLLVIRLGDNWGLMSLSENSIVEPTYNDLKVIDESLIRFSTNSEWVYYDQNGIFVKREEISNTDTYNGVYFEQ